MRDVCALITEIAGGTVIGVTDVYPQKTPPVSITLPHTFVNTVLGSDFSKKEIEDVFERLSLHTDSTDTAYVITPPFERTDLTIPEDLVDEVGRIIGYDRIKGKELPLIAQTPNQSRFRGIEKVKDFLVERGFTEISTQSFTKDGDILLANPLDTSKPALRTTLKDNMDVALTQAKQYVPRVLGPGEKPKLFEIGTIFTKKGEEVVLHTSEPVSDTPPIENDPEYTPKKVTLASFVPYSFYPFMLRDIAAFAPKGTDEKDFETLIRTHAGDLLVRIDLFDRFEKEGRMSYAFRLVFESMDKTLTDEEINTVMEKIYKEAVHAGYTIR
jgi:phenylalanyl-tRNA synthetase beta subunit